MTELKKNSENWKYLLIRIVSFEVCPLLDINLLGTDDRMNIKLIFQVSHCQPGAILTPRGHVWRCLWFSHLGDRRCSGKDAAKHPVMYKTASTAKNQPAQHANIVKAAELCSTWIRTRLLTQQPILQAVKVKHREKLGTTKTKLSPFIQILVFKTMPALAMLSFYRGSVVY